MREVKITSELNPTTDFLNLTDFSGFFCTSIQGLGATRETANLSVKTRSLVTENKPTFRIFSLGVNILTPYSQYEAAVKQLFDFLDRNKENGFRLYVNDNPSVYAKQRYVMCSLDSVNRNDKRQIVELRLAQHSFWLAEATTASGVAKVDISTGNWYEYANRGTEAEPYYAYSYKPFTTADYKIMNYYSTSYFNSGAQIGDAIDLEIENGSYNKVPLIVKVYGECTNPVILLYENEGSVATRMVSVDVNIPADSWLEINSTIEGNGVYLCTVNTKDDIFHNIDLANGSPYMYVGNGKHRLHVIAMSNGSFSANAVFQEEYIA